MFPNDSIWLMQDMKSKTIFFLFAKVLPKVLIHIILSVCLNLKFNLKHEI